MSDERSDVCVCGDERWLHCGEDGGCTEETRTEGDPWGLDICWCDEFKPATDRPIIGTQQEMT